MDALRGRDHYAPNRPPKSSSTHPSSSACSSVAPASTLAVVVAYQAGGRNVENPSGRGPSNVPTPALSRAPGGWDGDLRPVVSPYHYLVGPRHLPRRGPLSCPIPVTVAGLFFLLTPRGGGPLAPRPGGMRYAR